MDIDKEFPDGHRAVVEIEPDDVSGDDPRKWGSLGTLEIFHDRASFQEAGRRIFGKKAEASVDALVRGEVVWRGNKPWLGIERYEHGNVAHAPCRRGNFPDREWDVSPIVGFWSPCAGDGCLKDARKLRRTGKDDAAAEALAASCASDLSTYDTWANGDVWYYSAELLDPQGKVVDRDSCGGLYGSDYAETTAQEVVDRWAAQHGQEKTA